MGLVLVTEPVSEPVVATELIDHLRLDEPVVDDAYIASLGQSAREVAETFTRRAFVTQTWDYLLDEFPTCHGGIITLPLPPLQSVTSVKYLDLAGVEQTLATTEYLVDTKGVRGRIAPAYGKSWPSTRTQMNAVTIRFVCGYGDASKVPQGIKDAILLMVGGGYEHRESIITGTIVDANPAVKSLLWTHRALEMA